MDVGGNFEIDEYDLNEIDYIFNRYFIIIRICVKHLTLFYLKVT